MIVSLILAVSFIAPMVSLASDIEFNAAQILVSLFLVGWLAGAIGLFMWQAWAWWLSLTGASLLLSYGAFLVIEGLTRTDDSGGAGFWVPAAASMFLLSVPLTTMLLVRRAKLLTAPTQT